jgi:hypothetical protein
MVLDLKILMYRNAYEIAKLWKIKADSDKEVLVALKQVKILSESNTALQQKLKELKVAAQVLVDIVEIPEDDAEVPLSLAQKLQKVPQCFLQYISVITRQYVSHVIGLVKSYWPQTPLDPLGEGVKSDYNDDQFDQYLTEVSPIADRIVDSLGRA